MRLNNELVSECVCQADSYAGTDNTSSKYNPDTVFGKTPKICDEAVEGCIAATEKERDKILAELNGSDVVAGPASE